MHKEKILNRLNNYKIIKNIFGGGNLNELVLLKDQQGKKYILQIVKEERPIVEYLTELFKTTGIGDSWRLRNIKEQIEFNKHCLKNGLLVPKIFECGANYLVREFIEGKIYSELLKELENPSIIKIYLDEIMKIHIKRIVLGDRWGPNEILTLNDKLYFFDFDIELLAENSKEFEIAEASYYSLANAKNKNKAFNILLDFFENNIAYLYNKRKVSQFLLNFVRFYKRKDKHNQTNEIIKKLVREV